MSKRSFLVAFVVFIFGIFFYFLNNQVYAGNLSCSITTTCNSPSVIIMRLASTSNSHAEMPTQTNYANLVCCSGPSGLGNSCGGGAHSVAANLSALTNAHAEQGTLSNYSNQICFSVPNGSTTVIYTTTSSCTGYDTTLFSMSSSTNAHVASPGTSTFQSGATMQVCASATSTGSTPPTVTNVTLNGAASIVLTPNATTSVSVSATLTDTNGCTFFPGATTTVMMYRSGVGSSTCAGSANNANCYVATAFTASSSCSSNVVNTTTTFGVYYFANATDASSSLFSSQNWLATVIYTNNAGSKGTGDATGQELLTLNAINVTTSSISYGTLFPNTNTGSTNQSTTVTNAGNSSTTLKISGTALVNGSNIIPTSSQAYSTSSFTYPGTSTALSGTATAVTSFLLVTPTTTTFVSSPIFWGLTVPSGNPTGTYSGTLTFAAVFTP